MDFTGKVALVTGAGKTLGRAYAEWLGARGAKVIVNNRAHTGIPSSAQEVADVINSSGGTAIIDEHSVEDEAGCRAMVDKAVTTFGRLDILICNAGITSEKKPLEALSLAEFNTIMNVNFYGALYPLMAALPGMIANNYGRIVLTTSAAGLYGQAGSAAYASSKAALVGLARGITIDNRRRNLKINVVAPYARTNMAKSINPKFSELMAPSQLAPMVGWLSSDECNESGGVFAVGAGRVRRVSIVEGKLVTLKGDDVSPLMASLSDLTDVYAPSSATNSALSLAPELLPGK